jgi:hypothetical protein
MKKSRKLESHVANSNIAIDTLPTLQISVGIIAFFEQIYDGDRRADSYRVLNIGEDVKYRTVFQLSL